MKPKFEVGQIVRYGQGVTALMKINTVLPNYGRPGQFRYYGEQCYGDAIGMYEADCSLATDEDLKTWTRERKKFRIKESKSPLE